MFCYLAAQQYNKDISWTHLTELYEMNRAGGGLALLHKLKFEHIHLSSYSKMRVDLAAQASKLYCMHLMSISPFAYAGFN